MEQPENTVTQRAPPAVLSYSCGSEPAYPQSGSLHLTLGLTSVPGSSTGKDRNNALSEKLTHKVKHVPPEL